MTKGEIQQLRKEHPDLLTRALNIESTAKEAGNLQTVSGLGRRLNWGDFIELVEEAEVNDPAAFFLRQIDFPSPPQCGPCYDGGPADDDQEAA